MMRQLGIEMTVLCKRDEVLSKLRENRETHTKLVAEARVGYVEQAKQALEKRLSALREGKLQTLTFSLSPPKDFTTVYDTAIAMLESHTGEMVELQADSFRHLMQDEWDWTREFVAANVRYSNETTAWASSKGLSFE